MKNGLHPIAVLRTLALAALALIAYPIQADLAADLSTRSPEDQVRDVGRKPAEVLDWLGIGLGMAVMDLVASGGWYTEVLSLAVGPEGVVYAQNPPMVYNFRDGLYNKALSARLADGRLANVVRLDRDLGEVGLEPGSMWRPRCRSSKRVTSRWRPRTYSETPMTTAAQWSSIRPFAARPIACSTS